MAETLSAEALAAEFDCLMTRAGITVPPQRRAAALVAYADLRGQIALLHGRYGPRRNHPTCSVWETGDGHAGPLHRRNGPPAAVRFRHIRDACARCAGTCRRTRRRTARVRPGHRGSRSGRCPPRRCGAEGGPRPRAVPRHPLRAEGHLRHRRHPHDLPFQIAPERGAEGGQRRRRAAARGRRCAAGQARDA